MLTKDDLFTSVSPTAIEVKQDSTPGGEKRKYAALTSKKRMPSQAERYQIGKLLEEHLTPKDANGIVVYLNGMTDDKIAKLAGPHISMDSVRNMRQQVFGQLRHFIPPSQANTLDARVTELERLNEIKEKVRLMLLDHHARLHKLEEALNKLAEEIGSALRA